MATCRGTRADGQPCGQQAKRGSGYCWLHGADAVPIPPHCVICRDPRRAEIDAALSGGAGPGEISQSFRVSAKMVRYHRARHMAAGPDRGRRGLMLRCRGIRADGRSCGHPADRGTAYCWQHDPARPRRAPNCAVCRHPRLARIEAALSGGARIPEVAVRFRVSESAVHYHRLRHMPPAGGEGDGGRGA
jgi:hypothetical protein